MYVGLFWLCCCVVVDVLGFGFVRCSVGFVVWVVVVGV